MEVYSKLKTSKEIKSIAREGLKGHRGLSILILITYSIISMVAAFIPIIGLLIMTVINGPLIFGMSKYFLNLSRKKEVEYITFFEGLKLFYPAMILRWLVKFILFLWSLIPIIFALFVFGFFFNSLLPPKEHIGFITQMSLVILVLFIPSIIAALGYSLSVFIQVDNPEMDIFEITKLSKEMMYGNKKKLICLIFSFFGWAFLCLFTFGIGFFFLVPYYFTTLASFYDDIKENYSEQSGPYNYGCNPESSNENSPENIDSCETSTSQDNSSK